MTEAATVDEFGRDIDRDEFGRDVRPEPVDFGRPRVYEDEERDERRRRRSSSDNISRGRSFKRSRQSPPRNTHDLDSYIPNYERDGYLPPPRHNGSEIPGDYGGLAGYSSFTPPSYMMYPQFTLQPQIYMSAPSSLPTHHVHVPDPFSQDHIVPFRQYVEWIKQERILPTPVGRECVEDLESNEEVKRRYELYRENYCIRQTRQFHSLHKDEHWMLERYHPEYTASREERLAAIKAELKVKWIHEISGGHWDNICYDEPEGHSVDRTEAGPKQDGGQETLHNHVLDENERRELAMKTLFIRYVPLKATRQSVLELFQDLKGFKSLALSDPKAPATKLNQGGSGNPGTDSSQLTDSARKEDRTPLHMALSHRVGWLLFESAEDAEKAMNEADGKRLEDVNLTFSYHPSSPLTPRVRVTPNDEFSAEERLSQDLETCKKLAEKLDEQWGCQDAGEETKKRIAKLLVPPSNVVDNKPHAPETENDLRQKESQDTKTENGSSGTVAKPGVRIDEGTTPVLDANHHSHRVGSSSIERVKQELDIWITYLRRVHLMCYYSGCVENDSCEELGRRCGDVYYRRRCPRDAPTFTGSSSQHAHGAIADLAESPGQKAAGDSAGNAPTDNAKGSMDSQNEKPKEGSKEHAQESAPQAPCKRSAGHTNRRREKTIQYMNRFDQKARWKLAPPSTTDLIPFGGKEIEWEIEAFLDEYVEEITPEKFKCKECTKLFRGERFLKKHLLGRHDGLYKSLKSELQYLNAYVADLNRISPREAQIPPTSLTSSSASAAAAAALNSFQNPAAAAAVAAAAAPAPLIPAGGPYPAASHHAIFPAAGPIPQMFPMQPMVPPQPTPTQLVQAYGITFPNRRFKRGYSRHDRSGPPHPHPIPHPHPSTVCSRDLPVDPRQVKSYIDLDAPAEGDISLKYD